MKKHICILAALALVACVPEGKESLDLSKVELSIETIEAAPEGGSYDVVVTSSEPWRVSGLCDWARPLTEEGRSGDKLTFVVDPSNSQDVQTTTFKVFAGSATKSLTINANPTIKAELLSESEVAVSCEASKVVVKVNTNDPDLQYDFGNADYISFVERKDAFGATSLSFKVDKSMLYVCREATFGIISKANRIDITLTQAQRDTVLCSNEGKFIDNLDEKDLTVELRANVPVEYELPSWIKEVKKEEASQADADGLKKTTLTLHLEASAGSRASTVTLKNSKDGKGVGSFYIKQQNPNPIYGTFPDATFREALDKWGWILSEPGSDRAEILAKGLTETSITLTSFGSYYETKSYSTYGLGVFPALTKVEINSNDNILLDLSDCKNISEVTFTMAYSLTGISLGDNPITELTFSNKFYFGSSAAKDFVISGSKLTDINMSSSYYYISYGYDRIETLDVSGCPALKSLGCNRSATGWSGDVTFSIQTVYVSAAQKAAIDAGTLTVDKYSDTQIVVK